VAQLRQLTRTDQFPLVIAENKNYGFRRNFYGLRTVGRIVTGLCCLGLAGVLIGQSIAGGHVFQPTALAAGLVIDLVLLVVWLTLPSAAQVRHAANEYATALLHAAVTLQSGAGVT
jgi:hypothetical protein